MNPVTDPVLLEVLNSGGEVPPEKQEELGQVTKPIQEVTDPALLAQLQQRRQPVPVVSPTIDEPLDPETPPENALQKFVGAGETALTVLSSMVAEPVAGLYGTIATAATGGNINKGVEALEAARNALSYVPRTQTGEANLEGLGETLQPVAEAVERVNRGLGDFAYDMTGSPTAAAAAYAFPTLLAEAVGVKGLRSLAKVTPAQNKLRAAQKVMLQDDVFKYNGDVAAVKLSSSGQVIPDVKAERLLDVGLNKNSVAVITNTTPETKQIMGKMLDKFDASQSNDVFELTTKMSDDIGQSVTKRLNVLQGRRKSLGGKLDNLVETKLSGLSVPLDEPISEFFGSLQKDFGVKLRMKQDGTFQLDKIGKTPLATKGLSPVKSMIEDTITLVNQKAKGGVANAKDAHKLKKLMDELANAQKAGEMGLSSNTHRRMLELRRGINQQIQEISPEYAKVNKDLGKTIEAMKPFSKYIKDGKTWDDAAVGDVVGAAMKNLGTDSATSSALRTDIAQLEGLVRDIGLKFPDDPRALVAFKNTVEDYFKVDTEALLKQVGKYDEALTSGLLDAGASLAVGNKFGMVHDVKNLRKMGVSKNKAEQLVKNKIKAKELIRDALK